MLKKLVFCLLITALLLPTIFNVGLCSAVFFENPFSSADRQRTGFINGNTDLASAGEYQPSVGDDYIVLFRGDASLAQIYDAVQPYPYRLLSFSEQRTLLITLEDPAGFETENAKIISSIEKDGIRAVLETGSQTGSGSGNAKHELMWELDAIGAAEAAEITSGSITAIVAVLDSGIDRKHPALSKAMILSGYDVTRGLANVETDLSGHGTKIAGIIAAHASADIPVQGVATGVSLLPIRISKDGKDIKTSDLIDGIYLATDSGSTVINMSFGGYERIEAEAAAVAYAYSKGCILVAAAGNEGNSTTVAGKYSYPASYDGVISVGSAGVGGIICGFSQYNDRLDISAPGERITVISSRDGKYTYSYENGTSFSAAYVSAAAALAASYSYRIISGAMFEKMLEYSTDGIKDEYSGYGLLNIPTLLAQANLPIIYNISNGQVFFDEIHARFYEGTAVLDGEEYLSGDTIFSHGSHELTLKGQYGERTVDFYVDTVRLDYKYFDTDNGSYFVFDRGTATVDGFPYTSGVLIKDPGTHEFLLTGPFGNTLSETISVSGDPPAIYGIEDGKSYDRFVCVSAVGNGKTYLDGTEFTDRAFVTEDGSHTVVSFNSDRSKSVEYSFSVNTGFKTTSSGFSSDTELLPDIEYSFLITYKRSENFIRIYGSNDFEYPIQTVNTNSQILFAGFYNNYFLVSHIHGFALIDRLDMYGNSGGKNVITYDYAQTFSFGFLYRDKLWLVGQDGIVYSASLETGSLVPVSDAGVSVSAAVLDPESGKLYMQSRELINELVTFDFKTQGCRHTKLNYSGTLIASSHGLLFFDSLAYSAETGRCVFEYSTTGHIHYAGMNGFVTDNAAYTYEGELVGIFDNLADYHLSKSSGESYMLMSDGTLVLLNKQVSDFPGACEFSDIIYAESYESNVYTRRMPVLSALNIRQLLCISQTNTLYAVFKDSRALYAFDADTLEPKAVYRLRYCPSYISASGDDVLVAFENAEYLFSTASGYWNIGFVPHAVAANSNHVFLLYDNRIYTVNVNQTTPAAVLPGIFAEYIACGPSTLYVGSAFDITAYNADTLAVSAQADIAFSGGISYENGRFIAGAYLLDPDSLEFITTCGTRITTACGNAVITKNGLFSVSREQYISKYIPNGDCITMSNSFDVYYFNAGYISVILSGGSDITVPATVSGVSDGAVITGSTVISSDKGTVFIDEAPFTSGSEFFTGGTHLLEVVLPWLDNTVISFSVVPAVEWISFNQPYISLDTGTKTKLKITVHPYGAFGDLIFSSDLPEVAEISENGYVIAKKSGLATITATIKGTDISAIMKLSVNDGGLVCTDNAYVMNDDGIIHGVPAGTDINEFLGSFSQSGGYLSLVKTDGYTAEDGFVKTGSLLQRFASNGSIIETLTVAVLGDIDGDGASTLCDSSLLFEYLRSGRSLEGSGFYACDVNGNSRVTAADLRALNTIVSTFTVSAPETEYMPDILAPVTAYQNGVIVLKLRLGSSVSAFKGRVCFDSGFISFLRMEASSGSLGTYLGDGCMSFSASGFSSGDVTHTLKIYLNVSDNAPDILNFTLSEMQLLDAQLCSVSDEMVNIPISCNDSDRLAVMSENSNLVFAAGKYTYILQTDTAQNELILDISFPKEHSVYLSSTALDELISTVTLEYDKNDGNAPVIYTFMVEKNDPPAVYDPPRLSELKIKGVLLNPVFSSELFNYNLRVGYEVVKLEIETVVSYDEVSVTIEGNTALETGPNLVRIICTSPDGAMAVYTVNVNREAETVSGESSEISVAPVSQSNSEPSDSAPPPSPPYNVLVPAVAAVLAVLLIVVLVVIKRRKSK